MKYLTGVYVTHTVNCAVLGLFVSLLFCSSAMAGDPTSSQLSYFNAYKSVYGSSWNMVWNKGNATPLAFYGGHFTPQTSSGSLSSNSLKIPSTYNVSSYTGLLNLAGCTPLPQPQLASLPMSGPSSKLIITAFSPSNMYISPNSLVAISTTDFMINAFVRLNKWFEFYQNELLNNDDEVFPTIGRQSFMCTGE